jgi:uncharacterized protein (TIGR03083 family)
MNDTAIAVDQITPITRAEAARIAATENERALDQLRSLSDEEWDRPTDCPGWDVRAMAGHVVGMTAGFTSYRTWMSMMRRGGKRAKAAGVPFIDGMTAMQVEENAPLSSADLMARYADVGARSASFRRRVIAPLRRMPMPQEFDGVKESWRLAYLLEVILTRDTWMHRVDIARATGRDMVLTPDHDGRIVADVVAEWARRHGAPFTLHLEGPAGGTFTHGAGGERITIDAVDFCRALSGRAEGAGLVARPVPF